MMRSCTRTNSSPMACRFCSGSVMPASAVRNCSVACSTATPGIRRTKSVSPSRISPVSTYTPRTRPAPSARCARVNATVESTPPLTKKNTPRSPAHCRISSSSMGTRWLGSQSGTAAANPKDEIRQVFPPARRVHHLGMELHAVELALRRRDGRHRARLRPPRHGKSRRERVHRIPMAHPDLLPSGHALEQRIATFIQLEHGQTVFAALARPHRAAQQVGHQLLPVADAEHGNSGSEDGRIYRRRARLQHARRAARNDDALGEFQLGSRGFAGAHLGVHAQFPHLARFQVAVLAAGVENDNLRCGVQISVYDRAGGFWTRRRGGAEKSAERLSLVAAPA